MGHHPDTGEVTKQETVKLCGDNHEHVYRVLRLSTLGCQALRCCFGIEPGTLVVSTVTNSVAVYGFQSTEARRLSSSVKGMRRSKNVCTPGVDVVAVFGDPVATAIELQWPSSRHFASLQGHTAAVKCCALSDDGRVLVSGGREGELFAWLLPQPLQQPSGSDDAPTVPVKLPLLGHSDATVKRCCISGDGRIAVSGDETGALRVWSLPGGELLTRLAATCGGASISALAASEDGGLLVSGSVSGQLVVWRRSGSSEDPACSYQQTQLPQRQAEQGAKVRCVALSPDGSHMASAGDDCKVSLWDVRTDSLLTCISEHARPVRWCAFSTDGHRLVSCGDDSVLCVIEAAILQPAAGPLRYALAVGMPEPLPLADQQEGGGAPSSPQIAAHKVKHGSGSVNSSAGGALSCSPALSTAAMACSGQAVAVGGALLRRVRITDGDRLLACAPMAPGDFEDYTGSGDGVLCAALGGEVLRLDAGASASAPCSEPLPPGGAGDRALYCSMEGDVLATSTKDGQLTLLRCGGQLGSEPYPALSCTLKGAKGVGVTVWGISLSVAQHCVAVVGHEGKQGSNSTWRLWLWDYASLELGDDDATRASSLAQQPLMALARLGSAKLNVQQLAAGGRVGTATAEGSAPSFAAAAGAAPSFSAAAGGDSLSCGAAGAVPMTPHGAALFGEATAFGDCRACKGGGVQALARFNPLRAYASRDVGLKCCAWAAGDLPGQGRVVVGSAAGWLVVVEAEAAAVAAATRTGAEHDHALLRYHMHSCEVAACAFASEDGLVASGGIDGSVVIWSVVTGLQLHLLNLHTAAIRTLSFDTGAGAHPAQHKRLAAGDAAGVVSCWDAQKGRLLAAATAHIGPVATCRFTSGCSSGSGCPELVSCGSDGCVAFVQVDDAIRRLYAEGFSSLYQHCKKSTKLLKLETTLLWHMRHGMIQDAAMLQGLVVESTRNSDAASLSMLLPLFERTGWLVHFGPISSGLTRRGSALSMPAFGGRHTAEGDVLQGGRSARHTLRTRSFNKELKGALSGSTYADMDGSNRSSNNVSSNKLQDDAQGAAGMVSPSTTPPNTTPTLGLSPCPSGKDRTARAAAALDTLNETEPGACAADDHHHLATAGNRILQQLRSRGNRRATCPSVFAHEDAGVHPDRLVGQGSEGASSETSGAAAAQLVAAGSEAAGSPLAVMTDASSGMLCSEGGTSSGMLAGEGEHPLTPSRTFLGSFKSRMRQWSGGGADTSTGAPTLGSMSLPLSQSHSASPARGAFAAAADAAVAAVAFQKAVERSKASFLPFSSWRQGSKGAGDLDGLQAMQAGAMVAGQQLVEGGKRPKYDGGDLLQVAIRTQQAQVVRVVVDALLEGRFSQASVMQHLYGALMALIHDPQHKRVCRRLLKHLPLLDNGEVEVDSRLTATTSHLYKCSAHGNSQGLWQSSDKAAAPFLEALDVLIKRSSWDESIVSLLLMPVIIGLRHTGAWLPRARNWLLARRSLKSREVVTVAARSKLVPVAGAAQIHHGSKNLLRQLVSAGVDADLYGKQLVSAVINVKWNSFARAFLLMQAVQFLVFVVLFLAYLAVAVYHNDPTWTTAEMVAQPAGQAAVVLEVILVIMMAGQAADEIKQMVHFKHEYFDSPWNYMDVTSCMFIAVISLLHITRANHQAFVVLIAMEVLLLCLRMLYFCMAHAHFGALLRMVLIVVKDMRYFFVLLVFLLCSFGLTFSVLLSSPGGPRDVELSFITANGTSMSTVVEGTKDSNPFSTFDNAMLQLFTTMLGDVDFATYESVLALGTVPARLAVILASVYAVLVLIVLVNLLIAIVDETYGVVKESEADQILRNKALIIDEIESTLTEACVADLNSRVLLPFVHVLVPQQSGASKVRKDTRYKISKLKQLIKTLAPPASSLPAAQLRGGGRGGGGGGTSRQAPLADKGGLDGGSTGLGVTAMAAGADLALLSPHPFQPQPQELSKLSAVVLELSAGVEAVSAARSRDTAALADVSVKVDALGGELSAVRELLAAVLQGMQQQQHMQLQYMQQQQQQQWRAVDASGSGGGDQQPMQPMQPLEAQQPPQPQPESPLSALGAGWDQAAAAAATIFGTGARRRSSGSGARGTPPRGTPRTSG